MKLVTEITMWWSELCYYLILWIIKRISLFDKITWWFKHVECKDKEVLSSSLSWTEKNLGSKGISYILENSAIHVWITYQSKSGMKLISVPFISHVYFPRYFWWLFFGALICLRPQLQFIFWQEFGLMTKFETSLLLIRMCWTEKNNEIQKS